MMTGPGGECPSLDKFPLSTARKAVADLFRPDPRIYWADFLVAAVVAYAAAILYLRVESFGWLKWTLLATAAVALYRTSLFMHEIVHFRQGEMTAFKVVWNLVAGIPMLTPSFLYESHLAHHNTHQYGTGNDAEYLPLGTGGWGTLVSYLLQPLVLPFYVVFRFLVVGPVSFLHPRWRQWVLERMSALAINFRHRREIPLQAPRRLWAWIELACFLRAATMVGLWATGVTSAWHVCQIYSLAVATLTLNHVRTLVAHRYESTGTSLDYFGQLQDSINVEGRTPLAAMLFPVGLRYHALHHLFPSLPYHNLGAAHRRLIAALPGDSAYHRVTYPTFLAAMGELIGRIRESAVVRPLRSEQWYRRREANERDQSSGSGERISVA